MIRTFNQMPITPSRAYESADRVVQRTDRTIPEAADALTVAADACAGYSSLHFCATITSRSSASPD
jgi:hypothetical protein